MMAALKAEFRKVVTVRSTYGVLAFVLLLLGIFAFYAEGIRANAAAVANPGMLASEVVSAINATALFVSIVGALLVTHEYRYNTIIYTLTASKSRLRVVVAKIIVITGFSLLVTLIVGCLSPIFAYFGLTLHGLHLVPQVIPYKNLLWEGLFVGWSYSMAALLIAVLIRNQVGVMATMFLFQGTVEPLLALVIKDHYAAYLPYRALNAVLGGGPLSNVRAAIVFIVYLVVGWIVAMTLFVRRDAN